MRRTSLALGILYLLACGGTASQGPPEQAKPTTAEVAAAKPTPAAAGADEAPAKARPAPVKAAPPPPEPESDPDDVLYFRVGPKGQPAAHQGGVKFDPATPIRGAFTVGAKPYSYTLASKATRAGSMYKTKWDLRFFRGDPEANDGLERTILNNPAETGGAGGCNKLTDYANSDNLWIEIGIRGTQWSAAQACAALSRGP